MVSYEEAKRLVLDQYSGLWESELGVGLVIEDQKTQEYEWGWMFYYSPADPTRVAGEHWLAEAIKMALVDRVTGNVESVRTAGPDHAIVRLLQGRPPELRVGLMEVLGTTGVVQIRVADRAFQPLPRAESSE